jgi:hypothetical protein
MEQRLCGSEKPCWHIDKGSHFGAQYQFLTRCGVNVVAEPEVSTLSVIKPESGNKNFNATNTEDRHMSHAYAYYMHVPPKHTKCISWVVYVINVGQDSSVSIATSYGLDGPGIESRMGRDFLHPSKPTLGSTQPPIRWVPGLFPGDKAARAWRWRLFHIQRRG